MTKQLTPREIATTISITIRNYLEKAGHSFPDEVFEEGDSKCMFVSTPIYTVSNEEGWDWTAFGEMLAEDMDVQIQQFSEYHDLPVEGLYGLRVEVSAVLTVCTQLIVKLSPEE